MRVYARVTVTHEFLVTAGFRAVVDRAKAEALARAERENTTPAPRAKWRVQSRPSTFIPESTDILVDIETWALPPRPEPVTWDGSPW